MNEGKGGRGGFEQEVNSCQIGQNIIAPELTPPQMKRSSLKVFVFLLKFVLLYQEINDWVKN